MYDNEDTIQICDRIFKRILTLSKTPVINFINAVFDKDFSLDSEISYHWTENMKYDLERTIKDTTITVNGTEKFYIDVQINNDEPIKPGVLDYGYQSVRKRKKADTCKMTLEFPQSKIIFLEHDRNAPAHVVLEFDFLEQGKFEYNVPVMKFLSYSVDELNKRRMIILMPLYLLKLRREIEKSEKKGTVRKDAAALKALMDDGIIKSIYDNEKAGNITHEDMLVLIGLVNRLYEHLYGDIEEFKEEGVANMLSEKLILEFEVLREVVRDEAEEKKAMEVAERMVKKGMPPKDIAELTDISLATIKKLQIEYK